MKKLFAFVLIIVLLFSGCGAEKIGTDYDFSKVMEDTMANIIANAPNPGHSSIAGEWSIMVAARYGAEVPEGWYDTYYENLSKTLEEKSGVLTTTKHSNYSRAVLAVSAIGNAGFDPVYGARPLRRAIQQKIEDKLSEKLLEGAMESGAKYICNYENGEFRFDKA